MSAADAETRGDIAGARREPLPLPDERRAAPGRKRLRGADAPGQHVSDTSGRPAGTGAPRRPRPIATGTAASTGTAATGLIQIGGRPAARTTPPRPPPNAPAPPAPGPVAAAARAAGRGAA